MGYFSNIPVYIFSYPGHSDHKTGLNLRPPQISSVEASVMFTIRCNIQSLKQLNGFSSC